MRGDVQDIFRMTPHEKQVMMFSATLSKEVRPICRKFMQDVSYCQESCRLNWIHHTWVWECSSSNSKCRNLLPLPKFGEDNYDARRGCCLNPSTLCPLVVVGVISGHIRGWNWLSWAHLAWMGQSAFPSLQQFRRTVASAFRLLQSLIHAEGQNKAWHSCISWNCDVRSYQRVCCSFLF